VSDKIRVSASAIETTIAGIDLLLLDFI